MPMERISKSRVKLRFCIRHVAVHFCLTSIMRLNCHIRPWRETWKRTAFNLHKIIKGYGGILIYIKIIVDLCAEPLLFQCPPNRYIYD